MADKGSSAKNSKPQEGLTREENKEVKERRRLRAAVVYEIIRLEGEAELARKFNALWWSALAAGLSIGFSVLSQALLEAHLHSFPSAAIIADFGYCVGFLIVILARQQLFTENTLTAVLPVMVRKDWSGIWDVLRLWGIVLAGNLVGCIVFAAFLAYSGAFAEPTQTAITEIGRHLMANSPTEMFTKGIVSGWLIAALVWMLPSSEGTEIFIITLITYIIALGDFTHIIAGSVEAIYMVLIGEVGVGQAFGGFFIPTLLGNVAGGTVLFALISYAQVREELEG
ncbi:formate/nitrite transporter family protein [Methyloceanibacter sp.]|uniref:formate/nitrite transporter family protein n=1 Tax=Methyloceanibacter sp. TaxID=1965321 RepID=UPI002CC43BA4|nr:formate/nitrite transporter family protein [Methyloceanibacter sp.]HML92663.1 formate/nitrite transporter family protein [Methyloceanibacter sp.]